MHYKIHNGARDVETRTTRAQRPHHGGLTQFVMNGARRLVRGKPVQVHRDQLLQHIEELRKAEAEGVLYVTTMDGKVVDLYSFAELPAPPPVNPRPNPPPDLAANDKPQGLAMNEFAKEPAPPADFEMPVAPPAAAVEQPVQEPAPEGAEATPETQPEAAASDASSTPTVPEGGKKKKGR